MRVQISFLNVLNFISPRHKRPLHEIPVTDGGGSGKVGGSYRKLNVPYNASKFIKEVK